MLPLILALLASLLQSDPNAPRVILAFGDSMTAGYGVAADLSYPAQLEKALRQAGHNVSVVNQGVTASTTVQAMNRMTRALMAQPSIVIIQLGGNDAGQGIPREVTTRNLRTMIQRFQGFGVKVIFAGGRFPYLDQLAGEAGVPVVPFLEGLGRNPELFIEDGIHPNGDGYAKVVANIRKAVEPMLR
jgi:acyl-CoA thioesterase-1